LLLLNWLSPFSHLIEATLQPEGFSNASFNSTTKLPKRTFNLEIEKWRMTEINVEKPFFGGFL
jgi:hypothetical protein